MGILSKFIRGFASIFTRKSIGEKVWARLFAGYGAYGLPGAWSADRRELALHYRGWSYIAVRVIAEEIAALQPQVGFVRSPQDYEERIGEVLKSCHPGREKQAEAAFRKRFRSKSAVRKSLAQLQEHEEIELVDNDHRLLRLLRNPNNWDTGYTFWFRTSMQLDIHGNFYWWCIPDGTGRTCEIWVLPSNWVWPSPNRNKEEIVSYYEVRPYGTPGAASSFVIPAEEIVHGMYPGPISMWDGFSPQTAMAPWIDVLESMDACQFAGFKNGVGFDATIELDAAMEDPEQATLKRLQERLKERSGEGHHKEPLVMAPGAKLTYPRGVAPYEMDYSASGDQKKDWVLAGWGVSKFMAGLSEDVNKASSRVAVANFFRKVIRPRLLLIDGYATENLARELDDRLIVYHDDPTADDPEELRAQLTLEIQAKSVMINEIRTAFGREPIEGGDVIIGTPTDTPLLGPDAAENADELGEILATLKEAQQPEQPGMPGMPGMNGNGRSETGPTNRLPQAERNGKALHATRNGTMQKKNVKDKEGHEHASDTGQFTSGGGGTTATKEKPSKPENNLPKSPDFSGDVVGKGNTGEVRREGDTVIKNAVRPDGTETKEGEFYEQMKGVEGIAPGKRVGDEIHLPYYQEVLSVDTVTDEKIRKSMGDVVGPAKGRLLNAANALSEAGIDYNDPLQVGFDDDFKANLIDLSNAGHVPEGEALRANIERTVKFLEEFGAGSAADNISRSFGVYNYARGLSGGSKESAVNRVNNLAQKGNRAAEIIKSMGADKLAGYDVRHVYYSTNPRHVERDVLQSEPDRDGLKVILSNKPLDDDTIRQYSLTAVVHPAKKQAAAE